MISARGYEFMKYDILNAFREHLNAVCDNKNTADRYWFAVDKLFKDLQFNTLGEIPSETIERLLTAAPNKNRFSAAKNGLTHLKAFDKGLNLPPDKFFRETAARKKNRSVKPAKTIELDAVHRKVNAIRDVRLKTAFRLMERAGLRVSECAALTKRDIFIDGSAIKIDVRHGKGGSNDIVTAMLAGDGRPDDWLSGELSKLLEPLNNGEKPFYAAQTMKNKAHDLGIECHDFRRMAANAFRDERRADGGELYDANEETRDFLRHTRFSTTKRYLRNRKLKIVKPGKRKYKKGLTNGARGGIMVEDEGKTDMIDVEKSPPAEYKVLNEEQTQELQRQSDDVYRNKLTKGGRWTEKDAVDNYTDGGHNTLNPLLYGNSTDSPQVQEMYRKDIQLIDSAMDKFSLDRNLVAYSGTKAKHYIDWNVGDEKTIPAYLSTTLKPKIAKSFYDDAKKQSEPLMIEVRVPKGTKCLYVGDNTKYIEREDELLLGRGLKYKVIAKKGDKMIIEVIL